MINTSTAYKQQVKASGRKFVARGNITFPTGVTVPLTSESFMHDGIRISDSTSADNEFSIGMVAINKATVTLKNYDGRWNSYDFTAAVLNLEVGLLLPDGTTEWLQKGSFTVYDPVSRGGVLVEVAAKDNMQKFDQKYDTPLAYPATLAEILRDACTQCGVVLATQTFLNSDYTVAKRPADEATTYRDVVSYVAQLAGCWARCNNLGELALGWYDMDRLYQDSGDGISGGNFTDYNHDNVVSGGDFTTYDHDDILSGGVFRQGLQPPEEINFLKSCTISTDDVRVTGVQIIPDDDSKTTYFKGAQGYVVSVEKNPLAQDNLEQLTSNLAAKLIDFRFRPMQVSALDDPSIEAGDVAFVTDPKGHRYATIISNLSWSINSYETFSADAETPAERQQTRFSATAKAVQVAKQQAARQISTYDLMVQQLAETIAIAAGTYQTVEKLDDGSQIVYLHDKPTLAESQKIWKHTANAFAVSNDGGKTWAGMTADGNLIAAVLTVIGINCDWIQIRGKISSPVNPNVYFDVSAGILAASRLVGTNTGVYADIGQEEPEYGTSRGFFVYDKNGKFFQVIPFDNEAGTKFTTKKGAYMLSLGDVVIQSNSTGMDDTPNRIYLQKLTSGEGIIEVYRASASGMRKIIAFDETESLVEFYSASGAETWVSLKDGRVGIGTGGVERGSIDSGGWHGVFNIDDDVNMHGYSIVNADTVNTSDLNAPSRMSFQTGGVERGSIDSGGWHGVFNNSSDRDLKTNIEPANNIPALDKVNGLKFYSYNYLEPDPNTRMATITGYEGTAQLAEMQGVEVPDIAVEQPQVAGLKTNIGLMADEAPMEIAVTDDTGKPVGIGLYEYISLAAKAIQELSAKVTELEQRLAVLENGD